MKYNPHATPEPKTDGASPTFRGGARGRADGEVSERGESVGVRFVCVCVYSGRLGVTLTCVESPPALDPYDAPQRVLRPSIPRKRARRRRARRWLASPRGRSGLSRLGILRLQPDLHQLYRVEDDRRGDAGAAAAHQVLPQAPLRGRHRGLKALNVARARASSYRRPPTQRFWGGSSSSQTILSSLEIEILLVFDRRMANSGVGWVGESEASRGAKGGKTF